VNLVELQNELKASIRTAAQHLFGIELDQIVSEVPPRTDLGDVAFPVAFELAKQLKQQTGEKRAPRLIAESLKPFLETIDEVARVDVAGAGYLNVFYDRAELLTELAAVVSPDISDRSKPIEKTGRKLMVEHTSINPNKAAHIGHVRNAVLGDTFVHILSAAGNRV
jgi:arginyl-tRNA synthetase